MTIGVKPHKLSKIYRPFLLDGGNRNIQYEEAINRYAQYNTQNFKEILDNITIKYPYFFIIVDYYLNINGVKLSILKAIGDNKGECLYDDQEIACPYADIDHEESQSVYGYLTKNHNYSKTYEEMLTDNEFMCQAPHSHIGNWVHHSFFKVGYDTMLEGFFFSNLEDYERAKVFMHLGGDYEILY